MTWTFYFDALFNVDDLFRLCDPVADLHTSPFGYVPYLIASAQKLRPVLLT
jgi:hypothetical protein